MLFLQAGITYSPVILKYHRLIGSSVVYFVVFIAIFSLIKRKNFYSYFVFLLLNICILAVLEVFSLQLVKMEFKNTQFLNHVYVFLDSLTIGLFFIYLYKNSKLEKHIIYSVIILLLTILIGAFYKQGYLSMPSNSVLIENIIFIICSLLYLNNLIKASKSASFRFSAIFLFLIYILISNIILVIVFMFYDAALKTSDDLAMQFQIGKNIIGILCYFIWIYATLQLKPITPTATPKP
jgi:hypothetical protein